MPLTLGTVHHGTTHRDMLCAGDGRLPTMQVMQRCRQKVTRCVIPELPYIFCGRPEEYALLMCMKVAEFTAKQPLVDRAMEFMSWKEQGCKWRESLMARVVPGDHLRLFAMVRAASSRGVAKAKLFLEDMILLGEDDYARRNHRLTTIMRLPSGDHSSALSSEATRYSARLRATAPVEPFQWPAGRPSGSLSGGGAACAASITVVHYVW